MSLVDDVGTVFRDYNKFKDGLKIAAPIVPDQLVIKWNIEPGVDKHGMATLNGTWAEDGSPYQIHGPRPLLEYFIELQTKLTELWAL